MKIISKFKDFYDYLAQDYDADIYYIREARYKKMNAKTRGLYVKNWYEKTENSLLGCDLQFREKYGLKLGDVNLDGVIFGVYPFVYSTPVFLLYGRSEDYEVCWGDPLVVFPGQSFIESLKDIKEEKQLKKSISKFCKEQVKSFNKSIEKDWFYNSRKLADNVEYTLRRGNFEYSDITNYIGKIECREIFDTLGSPVFIERSEYINFNKYGEIKNKPNRNDESNYYVCDISFNELNPDIIRYWYNDLCDLNTYNYIENFLWSQKHEVASEQSNSEKILSHGFDLKTSFRKM